MATSQKSKTSQKSSNSGLLTFLLLLIGSVSFLLFRNLTKATPKNSLWLKFSKYGKYAAWIEAQAKHESANYTSDVFKRSNNPFGMKNAKKRKQLGKEVEGDPYRHYANIGEAIRDYILYLKEFKVPTNIGSYESYVRMLKQNGYFSDSIVNYLTGIERFLT